MAVGVLLGLCILGALFAKSYAKGGALGVQVNAPGAQVTVDGGSRIAITDAAGRAELEGIPFGAREVTVRHADYEQHASTVRPMWLMGSRLQTQLKPIPLTLTVHTNPGARVSLNGQSAGTADQNGLFVKESVQPGDYNIEIKLEGFQRVSRNQHLSPPGVTVYGHMSLSAERVQQMEAEQRQAQERAAKAQELIQVSRNLFNARQYQQALNAVNQALQLGGSNPEAEQLRQRITQTIQILK